MQKFPSFFAIDHNDMILLDATSLQLLFAPIAKFGPSTTTPS
jgi:hypothetical protein